MPLATLHPISQIISRLMVQKGLGTVPTTTSVREWPIYISDLPNTPDHLIRVTDTQGRNVGRIQNTGEMLDYQGFQITIRGRRYDLTYMKAQSIADTFDTDVYYEDVVLHNPDVTYKVQSITRTTDIQPIGSGISTRGRTLSDLVSFTINAVVCIVEG